MAKSKSDGSNEQVASLGDVERVREILFGRYMRENNQRLQRLEEGLERIQSDIRRMEEGWVTYRDESEAAVKQYRRESEDALLTARKDLESSQQALRNEMRQEVSRQQEQTEQTFAQFEDAKMERNTLGELFIELGNQMKGQDSVSMILQSLEALAASELPEDE